MSGICWWVATVDERDDLFADLVWDEVGADGEVVASGGGARDDAPLSPGATARAAAECESVDDRLARPVPEGLGRPHPDRARQFSPFAALRGYYELVHAKEVVPERRRPLTEEESAQLDEAVAALRRGRSVRCTFYRDGAYHSCEGVVSQVDLVYRDLWIVRMRIPFADICALEPLGADG